LKRKRKKPLFAIAFVIGGLITSTILTLANITRFICVGGIALIHVIEKTGKLLKRFGAVG